MNEKAMAAAAAKMGVKVVTLDCSGYTRLIAYRTNEMGSLVGGAVAVVETTDCSLPEARAKIVAEIGG